MGRLKAISKLSTLTNTFVIMKVIIVSIYTVLAFLMLSSFPTVDSGYFNFLYCLMERRSMGRNDPQMIPTQSELVEKDAGISVDVRNEKDSKTDVAPEQHGRMVNQKKYHIIKSKIVRSIKNLTTFFRTSYSYITKM